MRSLRLTILGSGTSHGVPMIGCDCPTCLSDDPRDQRTRPSALFTIDDQNVLIDTGPELRLQAIRAGLHTLAAVLYTHHHADHVTGLDDLRVFNQWQREPLQVYASQATLTRLEAMFAYAFEDDPDYPSAKPNLVTHLIDGPFEVAGETVTPVPLLHGKLPVLGFRIGDVAYCTDCSEIPEASFDLLRDLDVLILDGLRHTPHPTHFTVAQAVEAAGRIRARRTCLTHIAHQLKHAETCDALPAGITLAYDGLVIET